MHAWKRGFVDSVIWSEIWSESFSNKLAEIIKTGILLVDPEGRIRFANDPASTILDRSGSKDLVGKSIKTLFLPDDLRILLPNIMNLTLNGSSFEGEAMLRKGKKGSFFVNLSTALYKDNSSDNQFVIFAFQDITHIKEMEREYLGSERFSGLGMMTDQISHQIRNPIVSIGGFALRMAKEQTSPKEYAQYSAIIQNEAKRLEFIIDRLVEFARVQSIRYSPLSLPDIFGREKDIFGDNLQKHPLSIVFPDFGTLPGTPLYGDRDLLVQAIRCILQNSIEATGDKGKVSMEGDMVRNEVFIQVRDEGEGILPEHLPFVFDPFFTTRFNYLGLGLTMAKRIVDAHKGRITIESKVGTGTNVLIILPRDRRREIRTKLL